MKANLTRLSGRYQVALRAYLKQGPRASLQPATSLGRQTVALGLETLALARIHEQALTSLVPPGGSSTSSEAMIKRASAFFAEAIVPIEKTHRAALEADLQAKQLNQTLHRRTVEASASARQLQRGIVQRQAAELALKKSAKHRGRLLAESGRLQRHLRHLARGILSAQEDERQKTSHQLQDEIAQILLGIHVRLLTLKNAAKADTGSLKKEIASTQRLVKKSARTINHFGHEIGLHHET